jgi:hypothetical protein
MLLHARELAFEHPFTKEKMTITAPFQKEFIAILDKIGMDISGF